MSHRSRQGAALGQRRRSSRRPVAAVLALALVRRRARVQPARRPEPRSTLRIGQLQEPDNLNPFIGIQGTDYMLWHLNYDFLVGFDAKTLEPRPELATSWTISPDGKTWTFTIRRARSGRTACRSPPTTSPSPSTTSSRTTCSTWPSTPTASPAPRPSSDTTVEIYTKAPKANMLQHGRADPARAHLEQGQRQGGRRRSYQNKPPIIGAGPFQVVEWQKGKFVHLIANQNYWGGAPKIDELFFQLYTNPDTMSSDLKLGTSTAPSTCRSRSSSSSARRPASPTNKATSWQLHRAGHELLRPARTRRATLYCATSPSVRP